MDPDPKQINPDPGKSSGSKRILIHNDFFMLLVLKCYSKFLKRLFKFFRFLEKRLNFGCAKVFENVPVVKSDFSH